MNQYITTDTGGNPFVLDDIRFFLGQGTYTGGIIPAIENLLRAFGDDFIVQGCVLSGANPSKAHTAGWVMLGGELLHVDAVASGLDTAADSRFVKQTVNHADGSKVFLNGVTNDTYEINRAKVSGVSGNLDIEPDVATHLHRAELTGASLLDDSILHTVIQLRTKVIEIGDWDMDATTTVNILHKVADFTKIIDVTATVRDDADALYYRIDVQNSSVPQGGIQGWNSTVITLARLGAGSFDNTSFDATTYNRGHIKITYTI